MRTTYIDCELTELFAGYVVLCYIDDEYVLERMFHERWAAETFAHEWETQNG